MKNWIFIIIIALITVAVANIIQFGWRVKIGKALARNSQAFSFAPTQPDLRILIVGDSTAVGTGAAMPEQSTAGHFHQEFPNAEIVNISRNGAKISGITAMFQQAQGKFDLVLIQGGANNIIYFTPLPEAKQNMDALLKEAKKYSDNVVLLTSGNIGAAPIWPWPVNWIYTSRSRKFLAEFETLAQTNDVLFVKLFQEKSEDVFLNDIKKYYAADRLHLTGAGYKSWYNQIRATMTAGHINLIKKIRLN